MHAKSAFSLACFAPIRALASAPPRGETLVVEMKAAEDYTVNKKGEKRFQFHGHGKHANGFNATVWSTLQRSERTGSLGA